MHISHLGVAAVPIVKVVQHVVALHVAEPIPAVPGVASAMQAAVAPIIAREWVFALRVTVVIANLAGFTVHKDNPVAQGGVVDLVDTQLPTDVVAAEGMVQCLVLPADLLLAHDGVQALIITDVHHLIADNLLSLEGLVPIIVGDQLYIVTNRPPTEWGLQR